MATYTKALLSQSNSGLPITVVATSTATLTNIHAATAAGLHELWLWGNNTATANASALVTIMWGPTGNSGYIQTALSANGGLQLLVPGLILSNSATAQAFTTTNAATGIQIIGFVNIIN